MGNNNLLQQEPGVHSGKQQFVAEFFSSLFTFLFLLYFQSKILYCVLHDVGLSVFTRTIHLSVFSLSSHVVHIGLSLIVKMIDFSSSFLSLSAGWLLSAT